MTRQRMIRHPMPELPQNVERDLQRAIAIVLQVRQELTKQIERLDQLESELRLLVDGPDLPLVPLSNRQLEALRYVAQGLRTSEIAVQLNVAPDTVNGILSRIYRKLEVRNRNEAAFKAWKLGLI